MREKIKTTTKKIKNSIIALGMAGAIVLGLGESTIVVYATTVGGLQDQIKDTKNQINNITNNIADMEDEQDLIQEKIDDLTAEVINMLTSIGMKEDEIAEKEAELNRKEEEIEATQQEYEEAKIKEKEQYETMKRRIRHMYENNETSVLSYFLESDSLSDMLNKADYANAMYEYDQNMLEDYENTKLLVQSLWMQLETDKEQLEDDRIALQEERERMQIQKNELDNLLARKKQESANYDAEIARARQEAAAYQKKLQQEQRDLKKLQDQQKKPTAGGGGGSAGGGGGANPDATGGNYNVPAFDTSIIDQASGSELGKKIAKYACQFIGNPYVAGGTSLTNGADCSGFTYRVYSDFGYRLPRTSFEQRSSGTGVSYEEAQPGDLICYDGHIGIYVGGGYIVHASTAKTGIKVSKATYRSILSVRRII